MPTFLSQFSPQWTAPEALEEILVQRESLLAESVAKIRESILTANKHHLLFVGPRGAGKTHLITLIHHRLQTQELQDKVRFAWLNEEETATTFLKLLVLIYRSLSDRYPQEFPISTIGELGTEPMAAESKLGTTLLRQLGDRTVVVMLENLDSLFRHMPDTELLRWRAFVQNNPVIATIGTAQALFSGVSNRKEPFFGFFDLQNLEPLTVPEVRELLEKIARLQGKEELLAYLQTDAGKARVSAIHDLAGGNPRLYLIFSEFLTPESLDELVRPFEELVDRQLTSYYQERLRWLSPQQREIVQLLCRLGRPTPVKQIAEGLFAAHNSITNQLIPLKEMRYLSSRKSGREVYYELAEPLMRLALQVKETHNKKPLALIVDFLRVWHDRKEIEERIAQLGAGSLGGRYYAAALAAMDSDGSNLRHEILRQALESMPNEPCDDITLASARCLAQETDNTKDWIRLGRLYITRKEWLSAISVLTKVLERPGNTFRERSLGLMHRAEAYEQSEHLEEAIDDISSIIEMSDAPVGHTTAPLCVRAHLYLELGKEEHALRDVERVISSPTASTVEVTLALCFRSQLHEKAGKIELAILDCTRIVELSNNSTEDIAQALNRRARLHQSCDRLEQAIKDYSQVIRLAASREETGTAYTQRGIVFVLSMRDQDAIEDLTEAIGLVESHRELAIALLARSVAYARTYGYEDGLKDVARLVGLWENSEVREYLASRREIVATLSVSMILAGSNIRQWRKQIQKLLPCWIGIGILPSLGGKLVRHLSTLAKNELSHGAYDSWGNAWRNAVATLSTEHQEIFEVPLRLLRVGIEFLKTKDEGVLLALPIEERKILRETLELPPEQ